MLAIFKTGGKQYSVKAGQILKVEKLDGSKGDMISFNDILAVTDSSDHTIGTPLIKDAKIEATILDQIRDKKIIVFKKRQRQNYRHTQGHRQYLTVLQIESIILGTKKSTAPKKEIPNKVTATEIDTDIAKENKEVKAKKVIKKSTDVKKTPTKKKTVKKTQLEK
jgi:large subunit ribosomal protein L21|tara:strand:- start:441 stop:935 length:495 start_codon:yes stop_codon:yes gene_type:complete